MVVPEGSTPPNKGCGQASTDLLYIGVVTHNRHWNPHHFITDIKTVMCMEPGQGRDNILTSRIMFQVLAFLLAWGVGAAPGASGQRLRRNGEAQRDFGPISSTDLATHFGEKKVLVF